MEQLSEVFTEGLLNRVLPYVGGVIGVQMLSVGMSFYNDYKSRKNSEQILSSIKDINANLEVLSCRRRR